MRISAIFFSFLLGIVHCSVGKIDQPNSRAKPLAVFLDCEDCSDDYIRQNIDFVEFVRDRKVAELHLLITTQSIAGGGRQYQLHFIPLVADSLPEWTLQVNANQLQTELQVNELLTQTLTAGLLPYSWERFPLQIDVSPHEEIVMPVMQDDPWDYWIFEVGGSLDFNKESNQAEYEVRGEVNIERTTDQWRVRSEAEIQYEVNEVHRSNQFLASSLKQSHAEASVVKSLSNHWSTGVFSRVQSSTFNNINLGTTVQGALEYNFFPYRMSSTKEFTVAYLLGPQYFQYRKQTIYDQMQQYLLRQALKLEFNMRQPWGSVEFEVEGANFYHDWRKNRLEVESEISVRVFKGLFLQVAVEGGIIRDQLFLPKGNASLEEILLERKAIATDYAIDLRFGVVYTFGSVFNSIVNTRL